MNFPSLDNVKPEGEQDPLLLDQMSILLVKKQDAHGLYDTGEKLEKL